MTTVAARVSTSDPADAIRTGAGRCVACGLCLPHCPTFRKTKSELESPRGRLSLMLAMANGELEPSAKLESHLSLCLQCRACEAVCPAGVPFTATMDAARTHIRTGHTPSVWRRIGLHLILRATQPRAAALTVALLRLYQKSGLQWLLRHSGVLRIAGLAHAD